MRKRIICLIACLALLFTFGASASAASPLEVYVDGVAVPAPQAVAYSGTTYVSVYAVTLALRPDAAGGWVTDRMVMTGSDFELSAQPGTCYLKVNNRYLYLPDGVKTDDEGNILVPARTLAKALGASISWDGAVQLTTGGTPLQNGDTFYNAENVDLIARVIYHESGNQPFKGQLAVGNVILNRVASSAFPNSVYKVVYQRGQFSSATKCTPDAESILAAKLCLDGAVIASNAYWFNGAGKSCWASQNKTCVTTIGGHAFYG